MCDECNGSVFFVHAADRETYINQGKRPKKNIPLIFSFAKEKPSFITTVPGKPSFLPVPYRRAY